MYSHILTSITGLHVINQDAVKYFEDEDRIIAVVSDGLGSKKKSAEGSRLICKLAVSELKRTNLPVLASDLSCIDKWKRYLDVRSQLYEDYCTTCSFAVIDKSSKQISVGHIGDSPIFIKIDNQPVIIIRNEKEFLNVTDCIGGKTSNAFSVSNYKYNSSLNLLIASDGIGDELESSTMSELFTYLDNKYGNYKHRARSCQFTKEIKSTIGHLNNDDKSAIYIWAL